MRNGLPRRRPSSMKNLASCVAVKPSRKAAISGDRRSKISYPEAHNWNCQHQCREGVGPGETRYRIAASRRQGVDLQHRIVWRHRLERDIGMPPNAREPARVVELVGKATPGLLLFAADDADLVAELAALLCKGVNVETWRFGLHPLVLCLSLFLLDLTSMEGNDGHCRQENSISCKAHASALDWHPGYGGRQRHVQTLGFCQRSLLIERTKPLPVVARSLINWSLWEDSSSSITCSPSNSRPMTGVTSLWGYVSREPEYTKGVRQRLRACSWPPRMESTSWFPDCFNVPLSPRDPIFTHASSDENRNSRMGCTRHIQHYILVQI